MNSRLKALIAVLAIALPAASPVPTLRAATEGGAGPAPALTPRERRGRAVYLRGESASGGEIVARVGELDMPASAVTCAGCHGPRGEGKTEGGVTAVPLAWAALAKPYGHAHPSGRKHGPFDDASFARAVTAGVDPAGNPLHVAMPRYTMSAEDMADLVAYLKRIESDRDPGVGARSIAVAAILPGKGALAEAAAATKDVLAAYFADVNGRGGIYNRRIELRVYDAGDAAESTAAAREAVRRGEAFAFVGSVCAGADREVAALAREEEVPFVGAATLLPVAEAPPNRYLFYLLPGVGEQARALVNFAASRPGADRSRAVIVYSDTDLGAAAAAAAEDQARKSGWGAVSKHAYGRGDLDAARLGRESNARDASALFFFGAGAEAAAFAGAAGGGRTPNLFLLGVLAGKDLVDPMADDTRARTFLAFPTVPADATAAGLAELRALGERSGFAPRHTASQLSALAAAKVFVEGLTRAGEDVTREKLVVALEGLYDFETGVTPRLTFGPNRRVGAAGAYVVTIDAATGQFVLAGGWVKAN